MFFQKSSGQEFGVSFREVVFSLKAEVSQGLFDFDFRGGLHFDKTPHRRDTIQADMTVFPGPDFSGFFHNDPGGKSQSEEDFFGGLKIADLDFGFGARFKTPFFFGAFEGQEKFFPFRPVLSAQPQAAAPFQRVAVRSFQIQIRFADLFEKNSIHFSQLRFERSQRRDSDFGFDFNFHSLWFPIHLRDYVYQPGFYNDHFFGFLSIQDGLNFRMRQGQPFNFLFICIGGNAEAVFDFAAYL